MARDSYVLHIYLVSELNSFWGILTYGYKFESFNLDIK